MGIKLDIYIYVHIHIYKCIYIYIIDSTNKKMLVKINMINQQEM